MEEGQGEGSNTGSFGCLFALVSTSSSGFIQDTTWDCSHYGRGYIKPGRLCLQHFPTRLCIFLSSHMPLSIPHGMKLSPSVSCCKNTPQLGCNAVLTLRQIKTSPAKWDHGALEPAVRIPQQSRREGRPTALWYVCDRWDSSEGCGHKSNSAGLALELEISIQFTVT